MKTTSAITAGTGNTSISHNVLKGMLF